MVPRQREPDLGLKGAKMPAIMQHTYRCDAIHRGRAPRRSCSRTLKVETDTGGAVRLSGSMNLESVSDGAGRWTAPDRPGPVLCSPHHLASAGLAKVETRSVPSANQPATSGVTGRTFV
jgi:hypothetical protein